MVGTCEGKLRYKITLVIRQSDLTDAVVACGVVHTPNSGILSKWVLLEGDFPILSKVTTRSDVFDSVLDFFGRRPLQRPLQHLVERGFCLIVFLLRDIPLLVLNFKLEEFLFQIFQE